MILQNFEWVTRRGRRLRQGVGLNFVEQLAEYRRGNLVNNPDRETEISERKRDNNLECIFGSVGMRNEGIRKSP